MANFPDSDTSDYPSTACKQPIPGLISVITPCYNAATHLPDAISSVLAQSYPEVELILVDDGSDDERTWTLCTDAARRHPRRIIAVQQNNQGPYPARNRGLSAARGEFVAFLDADDYWSCDALSTLHRALTSNQSDIAYCGWQNVGRSEQESRPYIPPIYNIEDITWRFLHGCPWPIHAALLHRRIADDVGGFSTKRFSSMDFDFWLRASTKVRRIVRVDKVLSYYRWHAEGQISSNKWRQVIDAWQVRTDFIRDNDDLVRQFSPDLLGKLLSDSILSEAYKAFWRRDLMTAYHLFRKALLVRYCQVKDLKYALPTVLPQSTYIFLMRAFLRLRDRSSHA